MPNITVETDTVQQAGSKIVGLSGQIADLIKQMQATANSVSWTGTARNAYNSANQEWQTAANNIQQAAGQIGKATGVAAGNYDQAESTNSGMFG